MSELLQTAVIVSILTTTIRISTPLLIAAMGELVTERSGVMNLGLEGTMLTGAFVAFWIAFSDNSLWVATGGAMLAGGFVGLLLAFMVITLKVDQTVTGLALNLLASGLTLFVFKAIFEESDTAVPTIEPFSEVPIPLLADVPYLGQIFFSHRLLTYISFLLIPIIAFFLSRTRLGLEIRSVGENPRAVDMKGLPVSRLRYVAVAFGGMMAGLAGAFLTVGLSSRFIPEMTAGRGWLAIVIVIAGNWQPLRMLLATLIFAILNAIQLQVQGVGIQIPFQILLAMPYIIAILVLMSSRVRSSEPGALGVPYLKE